MASGTESCSNPLVPAITRIRACRLEGRIGLLESCGLADKGTRPIVAAQQSATFRTGVSMSISLLDPYQLQSRLVELFSASTPRAASPRLPGSLFHGSHGLLVPVPTHRK